MTNRKANWKQNQARKAVRSPGSRPENMAAMAAVYVSAVRQREQEEELALSPVEELLRAIFLDEDGLIRAEYDTDPESYSEVIST